MENRRSFVVDVYGNPKGVPGSGGYRDDNQRFTALYTNPRPYIEHRQPQRIIVDNSAYVRNEMKAQMIGFGLELAFDGIHYLWNQPSVRRVVDRGVEKAVLGFDDWLWRKREEKERSQAQEQKRKTAEYHRNSDRYLNGQQQGYGSWREIDKESQRTTRTAALPQKQSAYQGIEKKNDMVVISRAEYEALKRQGKIIVVKEKNNMGGQQNDSV